MARRRKSQKMCILDSVSVSVYPASYQFIDATAQYCDITGLSRCKETQVESKFRLSWHVENETTVYSQRRYRRCTEQVAY